MKSINFDDNTLFRSDELGVRLGYKLSNIDVIQEILIIKECEILTDNFKDDNRLIDIDNIEDINVFIFLYVGSVLKNNNMAERRKIPPYDIALRQKISFGNKICQNYVYVDDEIFGVVVGGKFSNAIRLVEASFPIMSKIPYKIEIRFFPMSRN